MTVHLLKSNCTKLHLLPFRAGLLNRGDVGIAGKGSPTEDGDFAPPAAAFLALRRAVKLIFTNTI